MQLEEDDFKGKASGDNAVNNLAILSVERMREKEKTKRLLIIIVFLLVALAIVIMLFSPPEKESVAYVIGAVLIVLALGAIGAPKFALKLFGISIETSGRYK